MGLAITSPDITNLDFDLLYDISGATPAITLTNTSTVVNAANLIWWYVITTPSGTPIHEGSLASPDVSNVAWTTLSITPGTWPQIFGQGICAQIEFSCAAPYVTTLYVKDSAGNTYSLAKQQTICRPAGNNANSCGNFGVAQVGIKTDCVNARLICQDNTSYAYQSQLSPATQTSQWTLVYPQSPSGAQPTNGTANNTPTAIFSLSYGGEGFNLYVRDFATYSMGDGVSIKIQYKVQKTFNVYCNIDLCQLQCEMARFYELATQTCGTIEDPEVNKKMSRITYLYVQVLTGILQPLCNIDVPALIVEIEALFGFESTCCCQNGVNMSIAPILPSGDCCTVTVSVLDIATDAAPTSCPNSPFPSSVYDPTGTTIIGVATDADNMVSLLNSNAEWLAYGVALNAGNCDVGWVLADTSVIPPAVYIATPSTDCVDDQQRYILTIMDYCTSGVATPADLPLNVFVDFGLGEDPSYVYGTSMSQIITDMNALPSKPSSVTFADASSASSLAIDVFNDSCSDYDATIVISCDKGSSAFLVFGASHANYAGTPPPIAGAIIGYGMKDNAVIGEVPGVSSSSIQWHVIKIGNTLVYSESDTGKIYFLDITNPRVPVFIRYIQLTTVDADNFTGLPVSRGIDGGLVNSFFSLYFPTDDFGTMSLSELYVFESTTGSAWKLNMYDAGSGVTAAFQANVLVGMVPRVLQNNTIFFTMDGTLAADIGAPIPVPVGYIGVIDLTAPFNAGAYSTKAIIGGGVDEVWAASFNGSDSIFFMGENGTLMKYVIATDSVTSGLLNAMGGQSFVLRGNIKCYLNNTIYASSLGAFTPGTAKGAMKINITSFPSSTTPTFFNTGLASTELCKNVHNIQPLGNCMVLVTTEEYGATYFSTERGRIMVFDVDGVFLMEVYLGVGQNMYNVIPIPNVFTYTPTSLIP